MAKYNILNSLGQVRASGYPTYHGAYGKPAYLEFNIYSPTPIAFAVGDYVNYRGQTFTLFSVPEPKKQARSGEAGDAFYYQGIQFHEQTRELENLIFTDLVKNSQGYFFSSRESTSTYENLAGIASRLEACISRQSESVWVVEVAPEVYSDTDLNAVASEPQEFPISGQSILDALNQVADIFKGIGWLYHYNNESDEHTITFGAPNVRSVAGTTGPFVYGKGGGLISLKKYITNKDKLCTRLYAYGSDRNMPLRHYNSQSIKSAQSVDIPNLMIPISEWGRTDNLPDAIKAFLEENSAVEAYGLIPRRVYFNNEENGDIYPSVKGMTIGEVEEAVESGRYQDIQYFQPDRMEYPDDDERVDEIKSAINPTDNGEINDTLTTETGKLNAATFSEKHFNAGAGSIEVPYGHPNISTSVLYSTGLAATNTAGDYVMSGRSTGGFSLCEVRLPYVSDPDTIKGQEFYLQLKCGDNIIAEFELGTVLSSQTSSSLIYKVYFRGPYVRYFSVLEEYGITNITGYVVGAFYGQLTQYIEPLEAYVRSLGETKFDVTHNFPQNRIAKVFIKQIGFDLNDVTALNGALGTLNVLDGLCGGRSFKIKSCEYNAIASSDDYCLVIERIQDDSTGMLYPNATFPLQSGDKFVLTDIYMPDLYVARAENQLLAAAQSYYALNSSPKWLYTPEVDSSFLADGDATMPKAGMYMELNDAEITGGTTEYILIDSVTIAEGDSSIPVVGVTLRERLNVPSAT